MNRMLKRVFSTFRINYDKQALTEKLKMKAWLIHEYGGIQNAQLGETRLPIIRSPTDVLVQVHSASVNPIDVLMMGGYGNTLLQMMRKGELELPLTVGRDFSGTVLAKGLGVSDEYKIGDEVYGFVPLYKPGTFSEAVLTDSSYILPKPKHLNHVESASLVYTTMTAWSALFVFGNMITKQKEGLRVLILGASGGVGTCAVQLLKSQGCEVFGTCAEDAVPLVKKLGADCVFDYKDKDYVQKVANEGRYHIVLDGAKMGPQNIPKEWQYDTYISLNSPLLKNTDQYGLLPGLVTSINSLISTNLDRCQQGGRATWGFFVPSASGFQFIHELIVNKKIQPVIQHTFTFDKLPEALETIEKGHLRGKVVIDFKN
uniref:Reticulon-4-interacting protein 1, mitochondrial n=1 Tax=Diabrotica virgifera virgifera TaxID=50390 RepID=A0A6P7GWY5_DIAVI